MSDIDDFELDLNDLEEDGPSFIIDIDGYEGPIDVLLTLARDQKLDLTKISILALADQYLAFVAEARRSNLELAADYLVMAAWLAYLKSKLLLPDLGGGDEPTGEEMAAALAFQLKRLEAMQKAGNKLMSRDRLYQGFYPRGTPEKLKPVTTAVWDVSLYELLKAYGTGKKRGHGHDPLQIEAFEIYTVENALERLRTLLGATPDWHDLWGYLPKHITGELLVRSAVAATFAASLEMAKEGKLKLRQTATFGPIQLKSGIRDDSEQQNENSSSTMET